MSKKYKNKTCVYCVVEGASAEGDHVVSREFFLPEHRANLPKVPACKACNNAKSVLELYLTAVMPFGARHPLASRTLAEMVPARLARNRKLQSALAREVSGLFGANEQPARDAENSLPFDSERLIRLFEFIAQGLAYYHWGVYFPSETHHVRGAFMIDAGRDFFEKLMSMNAAARVKDTLGGGAFAYEGAQAVESPQLTVWRLSFYGAQLSGDARVPEFRSTDAYVLTAPRRLPATSKFVGMLDAAIRQPLSNALEPR